MILNRRAFISKTALTAGTLAFGSSAFGQKASEDAFQLPDLPYAPDALAPHIDAQTMRIHHGKHHAGYTAKLNKALASVPKMEGASIEEILKSLPKVLDPTIRTSLRNNGGGYFNHKLFWEIMAPAGQTGQPSSALSRAIDQSFGSLEKLQEAVTRAALTQFGSGWAWLIVQDGKLMVTSTANQDNPLMQGLIPNRALGTPILGVDVWEHAYYLKYQNQRGAYLSAWWEVVNWDRVSQNFDQA